MTDIGELHDELDREAEDARVDAMNDAAMDALEAEDELEQLEGMSQDEIDYLDQQEANIDAERSAYYGDLGIS